MLSLKQVRNLMLAIAGVSCLGLATEQSALAATLTFDELPRQSVNGLSVSGVTFGFTVNGSASTDAYYNHSDPLAMITYLQGATLEGTSAGTLSLNFANPIASLQFGVALLYLGPVTPGFMVSLFDPTLTPLATSTVNTTSLISFTEGLFSYSGTSVQRATIAFNQTQASRFALDNLTFELAQTRPIPELVLDNPILEPIQTQAVPEPTTIGGILLAISGLVGARSRRKSRLK